MTRDELIALAKEADEGFMNDYGDLAESLVGLEAIERFAALVAAKEREACALVCDDVGEGDNGYGCAAKIRARKP